MTSQVWIVYAHTFDGCRFALKAYGGTKGLEKAKAHVERCMAPMLGDMNAASPADMLGFSAVTLEPLAVEGD